MVQPLISGVVKRMKMSSNLAKRKRDQDEPYEEDWGQETYSNSSNHVMMMSMVKERLPHLADQIRKTYLLETCEIKEGQ